MSAKPILLILSVALLACPAVAHGGGGFPSPGPLAHVLVCAPFQANAASTRKDYWKSNGFSGLLLDAPEGAQDRPARSVTLLETRAAVDQLKAQGLANNFFHVHCKGRAFMPEGEFARLTAEVRALAAFSARSGARGLALDFDGGPSVDSSPLAASLLRSASRDQGRTFGEAFAAAIAEPHPDAETLLLIGDPFDLTSDELGFIQGLFDGLSRFQDLTLHIVIHPNACSVDCTPLRERTRQYRDMLRVQLSPQAFAWWRRNGGLGIGVANNDLTSARLVSDTYAVVLSQPNTEPALATDPPQATVISPPTGSDAKKLAFSDRIDSYLRAGWLEAGGVEAAVLCGNHGAALLFLDGSKAPLPLEARALPVHVTDLQTLERSTISLSKAVSLGPFDGPTLVEDLPVHEWAVPAGLWLEPEAPLTQGGQSIPVRYGWTNRTQWTFDGTLEAAVPKGFSLQPRNQAVHLAPGDALLVDGTLQGRADRLREVKVRLILATPGAPSTVCIFSIPVSPPLLWESDAGGPVSSAPVAARWEEGATADLLVAAGDTVVCLDGSGRERWRTPMAQATHAEPAMLRDAEGRGHALLLDRAGTLSCADSAGRLKWTATLGAASAQHAPLAANLDTAPGEEAIAGAENGRVCAWDSRGKLLWETRVKGPVNTMDALDINEDGLDECIVLSQVLTALGPAGETLWITPDEVGTPACPVLVADLHGDWRWTLVAGTSDGGILCLDPATGAVRAQGRVPGGPAIGLACADLHNSPGQEILAATSKTLYCLTSGLSLLWEKALPMGAAPVVAETTHTPGILAPLRNGGLIYLTADGTPTWTDARPAGPLLATPLLIPHSDAGLLVALYGSRDHFVRAIQIPD